MQCRGFGGWLCEIPSGNENGHRLYCHKQHKIHALISSRKGLRLRFGSYKKKDLIVIFHISTWDPSDPDWAHKSTQEDAQVCHLQGEQMHQDTDGSVGTARMTDPI